VVKYKTEKEKELLESGIDSGAFTPLPASSGSLRKGIRIGVV